MSKFHPSKFGKKVTGLLKEYNIEYRDDLGQNFITNWALLENEVGYGNVENDDTVLEIGAGAGNLTEMIAKRAGNVISIEKDKQFEEILKNLEKEYDNIEFLFEDAMKIELPDFDKVISNLPYNVSLPLIFKILEKDFDSGVIMIQKDQAARITKSPGEKGYTRISVQVQRKADISIIKTVPKEAFKPIPNVDSAIIKIENVDEKFNVPSEKFFRKTLRFLFSCREMTLTESIEELKPYVQEESEVTSTSQKLEETTGQKKIKNLKPQEFGKISKIIKDKMEKPRSYYREYYEQKGLYKNTEV